MDIILYKWTPVESCAFKLYSVVLDTTIPALRGKKRGFYKEGALLQEKNTNVEVEKLNAWVTKQQKEFLKSKADIKGTSIANIVREAIELYENIETLNTNIDKICEIIDMQLERSLKKNLDRIIKLIVKGVISSESANHNTAEILANMNNVDINEIKNTAYHYAINYLQKRVNTNE